MRFTGSGETVTLLSHAGTGWSGDPLFCWNLLQVFSLSHVWTGYVRNWFNYVCMV